MLAGFEQWHEVEYHAWQCLCNGPNGIGWQHVGPTPPDRCEYIDCWVEAMKQQRCASCRWWNPDDRWCKSKGVGVCTQPADWYQAGDGTLYPPPDFGCVLWEGK